MVLGLYLSENEGANFWLSVLNDLQARGVEDILIASVDSLRGFPEAINAICPHVKPRVKCTTLFKKDIMHCISDTELYPLHSFKRSQAYLSSTH